MFSVLYSGPCAFYAEMAQALLDIRFPDVSEHGQGLHLMSYADTERPWRKLTLWHAIKPCKPNQHAIS